MKSRKEQQLVVVKEFLFLVQLDDVLGEDHMQYSNLEGRWEFYSRFVDNAWQLFLEGYKFFVIQFNKDDIEE